MLKTMMYSLIHAGLLCLMLGSAFAANKPLVDIQHWKTANGLRVYFVKSSQLPMLDIGLAFAAGSAYDGNTPGLAQLTNQLLGEATSTQDADAIANGFAQVGAIFSHAVERDQAQLFLRTVTTPTTLQPALDLLTAVLTDAEFPQANIDRIKQQTLVALQQQKQQPNYVANQAFYQALYAAHGYAHPVAGNPQSIAKITASQIQQFYQQYYVARNAVMVLVGDISVQQAKHIAATLAKPLSSGVAAKPQPIVKPSKPNPAQHTIAFPSSQTTIRIGQVGIGYHHPQYFPLYVGNYTLGGGGFASRLMKRIRVEHGLAYGISSAFVRLAANGPFVIGLQTKKATANHALQLTRDVLTQFIQQGPTPHELAAAKQHIIGSFALNLSSNKAIASNVLAMGFYQLPLDYLDTFRGKVNAVTLAQVKRAFANTLNPADMVTVAVGQPAATAHG